MRGWLAINLVEVGPAREGHCETPLAQDLLELELKLEASKRPSRICKL
jgi:hypothetical protein